MAIKESPSASIAADESQIAKAVLMPGDPRGYCHVAPWKLVALPAYPFSTEDYVLPAKVLLDQRREAESQER